MQPQPRLSLPTSPALQQPAQRVPLALPALSITVSRARRVLLSKALVQALNLQPDQRLDLIPQARGLPWLLDTKSRTGPPMRWRRDGKAWLTLAHHFGTEHFHKPALGTAGRTLATRTLTLTTEDPDRPGIYLLQPD